MFSKLLNSSFSRSLITFVIFESNENIFNIFTSLDEEFIFNVLFTITEIWMRENFNKSLLFIGQVISSFPLFNILFVIFTSFLKVLIGIEVFKSSSLWNSFPNLVIIILVISGINIEFWEVSVEIFLWWVANGFGLLDEVIVYLFTASCIILVCFLIHDMLISSLIVDSFSHVFVLLKTSHFFNKSFDNLN